MEIVTQDIKSVFLGNEQVTVDRQSDFLYGLQADGSVVKLFDPKELLPGLALPQTANILINSAVQVGADLYFARNFAEISSQTGYLFYSLDIMRMSADGSVNVVATFAHASVGQYGYVPISPTAVNLDGKYCISMHTFSGGTSLGAELYTVSSDGSINQISHIERLGYPGSTHGIAAVGATTFFIGDQQTPQKVDELWRVAPDGTNHLVFSNGTASVRDVESFGGKAWFVTFDQAHQSWNLMSSTEAGVVSMVNLGALGSPDFLDHVGDHLYATYFSTDTTRGGIAEIAVDGTMVQDFEIVRNEAAMHVVNAPSPGATASLAIAEYLLSQV